MNIRKAETDLKIARDILNEEDASEYEIDAAAYHIQQAVEKSLKYHLANVYSEDETLSSFKTHRIGTLIARCFSHGMTENDFPEGLLDMADIITEWEAGARYGEETVSDVEDVKKALDMADRMYKKTVEIERENPDEELENPNHRHGRR